MADFINPNLRVINIISAQPVSGIQQPQQSGSDAEQLALGKFHVGSLLSGFVVNRDASGNPILRTPSGDILFSSNFFLKIGSEITIRIESFAGNVSAHILSVNGMPPEVAATQSSFSGEPEVIVSDGIGQIYNTASNQTNRNGDNAHYTTYTAATENLQPEPKKAEASAITYSKSAVPALPTGAMAAGTLEITPDSISNNIIPNYANRIVTGKVVNIANYSPPTAVVPQGAQVSLKIIAINYAGNSTSVTANYISSPQNSNINITNTTPNGNNIITDAIEKLPIANVQASNPSTTEPKSDFTQNSSPILKVASTTNQPANNSSGIYNSAIPDQEFIPTAINKPFSEYSSSGYDKPLAQSSPEAAKIGNQFTATVFSMPDDNGVLLQTPIGIIKSSINREFLENLHRIPLQFPAADGKIEIIFDLVALSSANNNDEAEIDTQTVGNAKATNISDAAQAMSIATTPAPLTQLARNSGAIGDIFNIFSALGDNMNSSMLDFIENRIPSAMPASLGKSPSFSYEANLPVALLFFAKAIKTGDFRDWLGQQNVKYLEENGHTNLLKKAEGEFIAIAKQFTEPQPQGWQTLFFPIAVEGNLQQIRLFVKKDRKEQEKNGQRQTEEDTRFVLEVDLSNIGQMQLDGFVRRNPQQIMFDLVIRSHQPLSDEEKQDILRIYSDTGELTGYTGNVIFQTNKEFPVNPLEDIMAGKHREVVA